MKKKLSLFLTVMLAFAVVVAGCSGNDKTEGEGKSPDGAAAGTGPVKYTINVLDSKLTWDNNVSQKLTEKTGVSLEYVPIVGDRNQKLDLWLAGEDYPDIIIMQPKHIGKYRDAGAVIPLEDLIDQYGPNIKKKFGKYFDLLKDSDGHIYSLFSPVLTKETPATVTGEFAIQFDVLKEAGYPEVKTLDQLFEVLQAYYKNHPTIDGQPTIPFSGMGGADTPDYILNNPAFYAAGMPDHSWFLIDKDNNVTMNVTSDYTKRYYQFLNKLYNAGMLDKEFFTLNADGAQAKLAQGRILAGWLPSGFKNGAENALKASGKYERMLANFPIMFDENTKYLTNSITATNSNNNWSISKNTKQPERIVQFIDYLLSDEGQKLINWGIEGVHYDDNDGKRVRNPDYAAKLAANPDLGYKDGPSGPYTSFTVGNGAKLEDGDYATPLTKDYVASQYDPATKKILAKYGKQVWADFLPEPEVIPAYIWQLNEPTEGRAEMKRIEQVYKKESPNIIFAKDAAEFEARWNNYVAQAKKAGTEKVEKAYTVVWKNYIEQYNKAVGQ